MSAYKTYISYIIQKESQPVQGFEIADLPSPKYPFYYSSQQAVKRAEEKQQQLSTGKK